MIAKLHLPDVTLMTVTSVDIDQAHAALLHCAERVDFGAVKMLCAKMPATTDARVEYAAIPPIDFLGYSKFMIESLNASIHTGHCLVVQADGFILDASRWQPQFLEYDYIGAPWPEFVAVGSSGAPPLNLNKNTVGNGGFSLRSKKLLEATSRLRFDGLDFPIKSEDLLICHYLYDEMKAAGIRFAPPEIAAGFSIEATSGLYGQTFDSVFGFHGKHWLQEACNRTGIPIGMRRRNQSCPCGSGRKYKHCCGAHR